MTPQQLRFADVMNAGHAKNAALIPRRATKTSAFFALALGRCSSRENYLTAYSMLTTASKAGTRFRREIVLPLEQLYPDKRSRPFKINLSKGAESIEWPELGSLFQLVGANGDAFRSDAYDLIGLDEGGAADPELSEDVTAGAYPTGDTRAAQVIVLGTAAAFRSGNILWDQLERGRSGIGGILDYSGPDSLTEEELNDWDALVPHLLANHPGIGTLTTLEAIRENYEVFTRERFAREYLCIFGSAAASGGIMSMVGWEQGKLDIPMPARPPKDFALVLTVHPLSTTATITAVWRVKGKPRGLIIDKRPGVSWAAAEASRLARLYDVPLVHDDQAGATASVIEEIARSTKRPRVKLLPQTWANVQTAAALLVREVEKGRFEHWGEEGEQAALTEAVRIARKRGGGANSRGSWALGRPLGDDGADITPAEGIAMGLRVYDENPRRKSLMPPEDV